MAQAKKCEIPKCQDVTLIRLMHESSWTAEKFYCPHCGRIYVIPTTTGKVAQVSPLAMLGGFALAVLAHAGDALAHMGDAFDDLLS
jgi:hypothetical protein